MESAGLLWRQVDKAEMARRIKGQVVDTITKSEVRKIMDLLKESGRNIMFVEYNMNHKKTLDIDLFGLNIEELRCHYLKLNKKEINRPRMPANNLYIKSFGESLHVDIFKCVDDWFWVESQNDDYFICDGIQGLLSMLAEYYTPEEKQDNS